MDGHRPVSFELFRVLPSVCLSACEALLFHTAFSLAFFGALHIGELVCSSRWGLDSLQSADVQCSDNSVFFWIQRSKMDQAGWG